MLWSIRHGQTVSSPDRAAQGTSYLISHVGRPLFMSFLSNVPCNSIAKAANWNIGRGRGMEKGEKKSSAVGLWRRYVRVCVVYKCKCWGKIISEFSTYWHKHTAYLYTSTHATHTPYDNVMSDCFPYISPSPPLVPPGSWGASLAKWM